MKTTSYLLLILLVFTGCQKEITVDLPTGPQEIVVEGRIEQGLPPIIILTKTAGYFDPIDINSLQDMFVRNAIITVSDGSYSAQLTELCSQSLSPQDLILISEFTGIAPAQLQALNYCFYSTLDPSIFGQSGKTYALTINTQDGKTLTSSTHIPIPISLDSTWFRKINGPADTLGFVWAKLSDPDTLGNAYRWFARRINRYMHGPNTGEVKDPNYIAPLGSAFDDKFFNGTTFDFSTVRGRNPNSTKPDDNNAERGYYKVGDTVVVKFTSIDYQVYKFLFQAESQLGNNGSPFASPSTLPTNINGGVGVWAGYAVYMDTVVCNP
ncbi:MAG: DUF4249 family protein [Flavobacteriales bacterium]